MNRTSPLPSRDPQARPLPGGQPNEFDRRRIERALVARQRYRYVSPVVRPVDHGYLIESPCCSRNVAADGGVVDVALLRFVAESGVWQLFRKDHRAQEWCLHVAHGRLSELLEVLNADPLRLFWQ